MGNSVVLVGGDIIRAIDGEKLKDMDELTTFLDANTKVGQEVTLTLLRDGKEVQVKLTLGERPTE